MNCRILFPLCLLTALSATAAELGVLPPVTVQAPRWEADWLEAPAAVATLDLTGTQRGAQGLAIDEALNRLPGVYVQNRYNFAQGERLSIRGFGARAGFGIRGVRVLLDGIPLTLPDGQTELDGLDLALAERIELIRGPASALYGNAAGGVILITTPEPEWNAVQGTLSAGSFGFRSLRMQASGTHGDWGGLAAVSGTEIDGRRAHSAAEERNFYGKLVRRLDDGSLSLLFNHTEGEALDPGALSAAQVRADRDQANAANIRFDAGEEMTQSRVAAVLRRRPTTASEYQLRVFVGEREFANRLPFQDGGQVAFERIYGGLGAQYLQQGALAGQPNRFTVGVDLEFQRDDRRRYDNLASRRGARTLDQRERVDSLGLFAENEWLPAERWALTLGGRFDEVSLEVADELPADGDDSGDRRLSEWSYLAGLSYALAPRHRFYVNVGSAFETPTTNELANPAGGGFNPELESQRAVNRELGVKGEWSRVRYEATLFSIRVRNELVPFELAGQPGRTFYRNAGRSRRDGLELSASWQATEIWRLAGAYTYAQYEFEQYRLNGVDHAGNDIPGIPRQTLFLEAALDTGSRFAGLELLYVGSRYADDANREKVDGHHLVNLRGGMRRRLGATEAELYAGIRNLTDEDYPANVRINAFGERYFEPAPGRHYYAGMTLSY